MENNQENIQETTHETTNNNNIILFLIGLVVVLAVAGYLLYANVIQPGEVANKVQKVVKQEDTIKTFQVNGIPFSFDPKEIRVKNGDKVKIVFTNKEGFHDLVLDEFNVKTKQIGQGETETIEFVANKTGNFEYYCSVGDHRQKGMVGKLIVE